jgi:hypothetical protein
VTQSVPALHRLNFRRNSHNQQQGVSYVHSHDLLDGGIHRWCWPGGERFGQQYVLPGFIK